MGKWAGTAENRDPTNVRDRKEWYSVAWAISRTALRISRCMWLREAPNSGRGGARTWRSYFRFCFKRFCEYSNCTVSSGLWAGRAACLFLFWVQKCQKRPRQLYCSKCPVRMIWSILLHDYGSTTTRMTSRSSRKWSIKERSGTVSHCEIKFVWKEW